MITIGIIPTANQQEAVILVTALERAVNEGAVSQVDKLTKQLEQLQQDDAHAILDIEDWHLLNRRMREEDNGYEARYMLSPEVCARLSLIAEKTGFALVASLLFRAKETGQYVLQLPLGEESKSVP